jgi:large subunit ribosomal protein L22
MEITAQAKNIRISPQKVRIVMDEIKKMKPQEAIDVLALVNKHSAQPLKKVIASALANAKHNFGIEAGSLAFKTLQVGPGRLIKRFRPVSRGRAHAILKRTSHITIVLEGEKAKADKSNKQLVLPQPDKKEKGVKNGTKS